MISFILNHTTKILGYTNDPYAASIVTAIANSFANYGL